MFLTIDHVFICTSGGAPAADRLREFGLTEGSPNTHPGQGTACRRFFFRNAMLELLWVEDVAEAQSVQTRRTQLWERWSGAGRSASPFGIILRPALGTSQACPFPSWEYRPASMPDLALHVATGTELDEPMWCYLESGRPPSQALGHPCGFREITSIRIVSPPLNEASLSVAMARDKVIGWDAGPEHLLELTFDGNAPANGWDFRPDLPLVFRW